MKKRLIRSLASALYAFIVSSTVFADDLPQLAVPADREEDAAQICAQELEIFRQRAQGDMGYYLSLANPGYMSWPAPAELPLSYETLSRQVGDGRLMASGERISVS